MSPTEALPTIDCAILHPRCMAGISSSISIGLIVRYMTWATIERDGRHMVLGLPQGAVAWLTGKGMHGSQQQRRWLLSTAAWGHSARAPLAIGRQGSLPLAVRLSSSCRLSLTAMGELQAFINSLWLPWRHTTWNGCHTVRHACLCKLPCACLTSLLVLLPETAVMGQGLALGEHIAPC